MTTLFFWILGLVGGEFGFGFSVFVGCSFRRPVVFVSFRLPLKSRLRVYRTGVSPLRNIAASKSQRSRFTRVTQLFETKFGKMLHGGPEAILSMKPYLARRNKAESTKGSSVFQAGSFSRSIVKTITRVPFAIPKRWIRSHTSPSRKGPE